MHHVRHVAILLLVLGACGCAAGPSRDLSRDPAVGSAQTPFEFRAQRSDFNTTRARSGMIMPDPGADQMPQSRNSLPNAAP